jgi:hypothetical protein
MEVIAREQLNLQKSLNEILQIMSVNIFERTTLAELLAPAPAAPARIVDGHHTQNLLWPNE